MKISKCTTKDGVCGRPVTTELDTIIERMRSEKNREAVEQAAAGLYGGAADRLPRLLFSGTFGRSGTDDLRTMSGLLLMDVDCPQGTTQIDGVRLRVAQVPYTVLAFAGVSRRTLKVVVRVAYSNGHEPQEREDYERQLSEGQQTAVAIYRTLASCELRPAEQPLLTSCQLYVQSSLVPQYNPILEFLAG